MRSGSMRNLSIQARFTREANLATMTQQSVVNTGLTSPLGEMVKISHSISPPSHQISQSPIMLSAFLGEEHSRGKLNNVHLPPLPKG
jgi:hypothetical protein